MRKLLLLLAVGAVTATALLESQDLRTKGRGRFRGTPSAVNGNTLTVNPNGTANYTTIQACVNAAVAGDTCQVAAGTYNEYVTTARNGQSNGRITINAAGAATVLGFRIRHAYVTVNGFDITGYAGIDQASFRIEPGGDNCAITNNTVRDGIYLSSTAFAFDNATETMTNAAGGFLAAGFKPGMATYFASFANPNDRPDNHDNNVNDGTPDTFTIETRTIQSVTDTTLTFTAAADLWTEQGVTGTIYAQGSEKIGIWGVLMINSSETGTADGCVISDNTFDNLAGRVLHIEGNQTLITRNTFTRINGWRLLTLLCSDNTFSYNTVSNSPRWPNFVKPDTTIASEGSGTWDMYDGIFVSQVTAVSCQTDNNVIEYNFLQNVDAQFSNLTAYTPGLKGNTIAFRYNVLVDYELNGSWTRPGSVFEHNTFYRAAHKDTGQGVINLGYSTIGPSDPNPTIVKNNAFVESGDMFCASYTGSECTGGVATALQKSRRGWYNLDDGRSDGYQYTAGITADYNFVTGSEADGWPAKDALVFVADGQEANGINGGNPMFVNTADLLGPDNLPFTDDDGLRPQVGSPLCSGGEAGTFIGAYSCTVTDPCLDASTICVPSEQATIQLGVNAALAGQTVLVATGTYNERVTSARGGTSEADRIVIKAAPGATATVKGFEIDHAYITVQGFDITGHTVDTNGLIHVEDGAHYMKILDNTLRDTCTVAGACINTQEVGGILAQASGANTPDHVTVEGNTLTNLSYIIVTIIGDDWVVQNNRMSLNNRWDWFRVAGSRALIRRNVIGPGSNSTTTSNHPDFIQSFDDASGVYSAIDNVVEENFVYDITFPDGQLNQLNNSLAGTSGLVDDFHGLIFRRNVLINFPNNSNNSMPGITYDHNTFYRLAYTQDGLAGIGGTLSRGEAPNFTVKNNVLLANGSASSTVNGTSGFYSPAGESLSVESLNFAVTTEVPGSCTSGVAGCPTADAIFDDLFERGYINGNGFPTVAAKALASEASFFLDSPAYDTYKSATYTHLKLACTKDDTFRTTFLARNNYVAGAPAAGYPTKRSDTCDCTKTFTSQRFCEVACGLGGINGGNPSLQDYTNPLGPDGIAFTTDDGLKPLPGSVLCGAGENGTDIGAYSCNPNSVFAQFQWRELPLLAWAYDAVAKSREALTR